MNDKIFQIIRLVLNLYLTISWVYYVFEVKKLKKQIKELKNKG